MSRRHITNVPIPTECVIFIVRCFQVIVYPTKDSMKTVGTVVALLSIWLISLLMASPLLIFSVSQGVEPYPGVELYRVCVENPRLHYEKGAYSIASMIFQYIVPILIVSVAHARICNKLKYRMVNQQQRAAAASASGAGHGGALRSAEQRRLMTNSGVDVCANSPFQKRRTAREAKRKRKTNTLLLMIAIVFACSWMPLNVFNILADFDHQLLKALDSNGVAFAVCHLIVLSSACSNPLLYGWLNENFRREFVAIFCSPCCRRLRVRCHCAGAGDATDGGGARRPPEEASSRTGVGRAVTNGRGQHLDLPPAADFNSSSGIALSGISSANDWPTETDRRRRRLTNDWPTTDRRLTNRIGTRTSAAPTTNRRSDRPTTDRRLTDD